MKSHNAGETWGLDVLNESMIVTSGDDNKVMIWNTDDRVYAGGCIVNKVAKKNARKGASTLSKLPDSQCSRAVCYN